MELALDLEQLVEELQKLVDESSRIVFFGGAGVSTESGIPDFRSPDGLFHQQYPLPPETILSRRFFDAYPAEFFSFYREKLLNLWANPNPAHYALAKLEQAGKLSAVITQNIDGLHQKAGSKKVYELHGSTLRNYCMQCGKSYDATFVEEYDGVPRCTCGGIVKPDVVLYGEPLDSDVMNGAIAEIERADLLIIAGTTLRVHPAAGLVHWFRGEKVVVINYEAVGPNTDSQLNIRYPVGEVLGMLRIGERT